MTKLANPRNYTKTREVLTSYREATLVSQSGSNPPVKSESWTTSTINLTDQKSGQVCSNWKQLVRNGADASTGYFRKVQQVDIQSGYGKLTYQGTYVNPSTSLLKENWSEVSGCTCLTCPSLHNDSAGSHLKADNQALTRFYAAIRAEQEQLNALVTLGEGAETIRMLRRPFASLQNLTNRYLDTVERRVRSKMRRVYRRNRGVPVHEINKVIADSYLEWSFGVRPLLSDVESIAILAARLHEDTERRSRVQGYGEDTRGSPPSRGGGNFNSLIYVQTSTTQTTTRVKYRGGLNALVNWPKDDVARLRVLSGFRPENFVPTLHELLPWSFLADYFFNFGKVLEQEYTSTAGLVWALVSTHMKTVQVVERPLDYTSMRASPSYLRAEGTHLGRCEGTLSEFTRTVLNVGSLPTARVDSRPLSDLKGGQVANIAALVYSRAKKVSAFLLTASRGR